MKSISVLLLALIASSFVNTKLTSNTVIECLQKINVDDGFVGKYVKTDVTSPTAADVKVQTRKGRMLNSVVRNTPQTIESLLTAFYALTSANQAAIKKCSVSSTGAKARCEQAHGSGSCDVVAPGLANKRCPAGLKRYGTSICADKCPEGWTDRVVDCYKPDGYKTARYETKEECVKAAKNCEKFNLLYWVPRCRAGFSRVGPDACVAICEAGWEDHDRTCLKPQVVNVGKVFVWSPSDQ